MGAGGSMVHVVEVDGLTIRALLTPSTPGYRVHALGTDLGHAATPADAEALVRVSVGLARGELATAPDPDDPAPADDRIGRANARREEVLDEIAALEDELAALRDELADLDDEIDTLERRARRALAGHRR